VGRVCRFARPVGVIPLILIGTIVADSFAGERERHTLETLLASRLSDQAILLGKIGAVVSYVWLITQLVFIVALIPVNIFHGKGELLIYSPEVALSGLVLSFLLSCLMSSMGVLVSLRAGTVKQAQQTLEISVFVFAYVIPMVGIYLLRFVPEGTRNGLLQPILTGGIGTIVLGTSALLIVLTVSLFAITKAHFQRARPILSE
jgi:ABC-2 type transport system permease protein